MAVILAPILEGQLDTWKTYARDLAGSQSDAVADHNRRFGLTRHAAWLVETPAGPMAIALHEGPGVDDYMPKLAASQNEFDLKFKEILLAVHGMDFNQPPPGPMPELYFDTTG